MSEDNIKKIQYACRICGASGLFKCFTCLEMMYGTRSEFLYVKCGNCGCLQIKEYLNNIYDYYGSKYYSYAIKPKEEVSFENKIVYKQSTLLSIYKNFVLNRDLTIFKNIVPKKAAKILDIGSGSGAFLKKLKNAGYESLLGIDPFLNNEKLDCDGYTIEKKEIYDINDQYDAIILTHVFEHIPDQIRALKALRNILKNNGVIFITIPLVDSFAWHFYGTRWVQLDAPRHYYLHTRRSMNIIAAATNLCIDKIYYNSNGYQFWGSEQYKNNISMYDSRSLIIDKDKNKMFYIKTKLAWMKIASAFLNFIGKGDQALFILKKCQR